MENQQSYHVIVKEKLRITPIADSSSDISEDHFREEMHHYFVRGVDSGGEAIDQVEALFSTNGERKFIVEKSIPCKAFGDGKRTIEIYLM